jgi:hypothetical protein
MALRKMKMLAQNRHIFLYISYPRQVSFFRGLAAVRELNLYKCPKEISPDCASVTVVFPNLFSEIKSRQSCVSPLFGLDTI